MNSRLTILCALLLLGACTERPEISGPDGPDPTLKILSISPSSTYAGRGEITVTLVVDGDVSSMSVRSGERPMTSSPEGDSALAVLLPAELLASPGAVPLTVASGATTESTSFEVTGPLVARWTGETGQVAIGPASACAVADDARAYCWGSMDRGRLGIGTWGIGGRLAPVQVVGAPDGFVSVTGVDETFCGLMGDGSVRCWGGSFYGQAGVDGGVQDDASRVLPGARSFERIALAASHGCGLEDGEAWCWGRHGLGASGSGTPTSWSTEPVRVQTDLRFSQVTVGEDVTCALTGDGEPWCWGRRLRMGVGVDDREWSGPQPVQGGHRFLGVSSGESVTCGVDLEGRVWCWGQGDRDLPGGAIPGRVDGLPPVSGVSVGPRHACALDLTGGAWCWGWNGSLQLGTEGRGGPVPTASQAGPFKTIEVGVASTCAVRPDGRLACWGSRGRLPPQDGLLGDGRSLTSDAGGEVQGGRLYEQLSGLCGLSDGVAWCWGSGVRAPTALDAPEPLVQLGMRDAGAGCAIGTSGRVYCRSGAGLSLTEVTPGLSATAVAVGSDRVCALDTDGRAHCRLDPTDGAESEGFSVVSEGVRFVEIDAGQGQVCGRDVSGGVHCWGSNQWGSLGTTSSNDCVRLAPGECSLTPLAVPLPGPAVRVQVSGGSSCARLEDGRLFCWGETWAADWGCTFKANPYPCAFAPVEVPDGTGLLGYAGLRRARMCFVESTGGVTCTSSSWFRDPMLYAGPELLFPDVTVADLSITYRVTCVLAADGRILCQGSSEDGELGIDVALAHADPVTVDGIRAAAPAG